MEDAASNSRGTTATFGGVTVATVAHWPGQILSVAVADMQEILPLPQANHSSLWMLVSADRGSAILVVTDDFELDVLCREDLPRWSHAYGLTHVHDMLSRSRCRRLAALIARDMTRHDIVVPEVAPVELPESMEADMHHFHRIALVALAAAGLDLQSPHRTVQTREKKELNA